MKTILIAFVVFNTTYSQNNDSLSNRMVELYDSLNTNIVNVVGENYKPPVNSIVDVIYNRSINVKNDLVSLIDLYQLYTLITVEDNLTIGSQTLSPNIDNYVSQLDWSISELNQYLKHSKNKVLSDKVRRLTNTMKSIRQTNIYLKNKIIQKAP